MALGERCDEAGAAGGGGGGGMFVGIQGADDDPAGAAPGATPGAPTVLCSCHRFATTLGFLFKRY